MARAAQVRGTPFPRIGRTGQAGRAVVVQTLRLAEALVGGRLERRLAGL